jgi:hypothetical protein
VAIVTWQNLSSSLVDFVPRTSFANDFVGADTTSYAFHNISYVSYGSSAAIRTTFYLMLKKRVREKRTLKDTLPNK